MKEIFKIQVPLSSNMENPQVLIHNESGDTTIQLNYSHALIEFMAGEIKKFAVCKYDKSTKMLAILAEAPNQDW